MTNTGINLSTTLNNLVVSLKPSDPYKIVLFGSYANGNLTDHSDIDLMAILDTDHISTTYQERLDKKLYIRRLLREINREFALDLLVYSKAELKKIKEYGNTFITEVERTGKIIYEKVNRRIYRICKRRKKNN